MRRIYKYQLKTVDSQIIDVQALSEEKDFKNQVINIETQNGVPCLWCLVDVNQKTSPIKIRTIGTGAPMPLLSKDDYLGTYMLADQQLVFHVFVEKDEE